MSGRAGAKAVNWRGYTIVSLLGIVAVIIVATITKVWVLTAIPIGFLFGFFLEKADLCGSSAFSEAFMMKDWHKLGGIWVVIVTSMLGFSLLAGIGWIHLNPKPLIWANYIVGGILFGIGIVLAGGCVSGCLFKTGKGNINSIAGLIGIPIGVTAVAYGPLNGFAKGLRQYAVKAADGSSVTLSTLTQIPYWLLAIILAVITLIAAFILKKRRRASGTISFKQNDKPVIKRILTGRWKPWQAGIAIGILACFAYLSSASSGRNYPLGVTHGVMDVQVLLTDYPVKHIWQKKKPVEQNVSKSADSLPIDEPKKDIVWWLVLLVMALVIGSHISARISGKFNFMPRAPDEIVIAFFGGIILGIGATIASGCIVGNIMSGVALMSVGNILFAGVVLLSNWLTTYIYMMGGQRGQ
ncbi:MAG: hypothetical protein DRP51_09090 [Candidatus Zixiibacteriota bacterium]|nr:MAG: hypothetical protein DRP51_09090 [candidate division Zixibacteria bacterium]